MVGRFAYKIVPVRVMDWLALRLASVWLMSNVIINPHKGFSCRDSDDDLCDSDSDDE